jgi:hypothetical protein
MSFQLSSDAIRWARTDNGISKAVLVALADIAGNDGACFPSIDLIAKRVEFSRKSVMRAMVELEARGHLTAVRSRRGNRYVVHPVLDRSESPPQGHQKQDSGTSVVPHRDFTSPPQGLHKSPTGTSVVPHRDTKQSVSNQEATKVSNHLASAAANAGDRDSLFPIEPPQPKPKREPKPKPEGTADSRLKPIKDGLAPVFEKTKGREFDCDWKKTVGAIRRFLESRSKVTPDEFLEVWSLVCKYSSSPFYPKITDALDVAYLCRNYETVTGHIERAYHSEFQAKR